MPVASIRLWTLHLGPEGGNRGGEIVIAAPPPGRGCRLQCKLDGQVSEAPAEAGEGGGGVSTLTRGTSSPPPAIPAPLSSTHLGVSFHTSSPHFSPSSPDKQGSLAQSESAVTSAGCPLAQA